MISKIKYANQNNYRIILEDAKEKVFEWAAY